METQTVVAITNVTFDGTRYRPGAAFELPAPCAHALAAAGNVRLPEPAPQRDSSSEQRTDESDGRPASEPAAASTAPQPDGGASPDESKPPTPLEDISGIGPSTAERLRAAGVADVVALSALTDEQLDALRVRASWREQARALAGAQ